MSIESQSYATEAERIAKTHVLGFPNQGTDLAMVKCLCCGWARLKPDYTSMSDSGWYAQMNRAHAAYVAIIEMLAGRSSNLSYEDKSRHIWELELSLDGLVAEINRLRAGIVATISSLSDDELGPWREPEAYQVADEARELLEALL